LLFPNSLGPLLSEVLPIRNSFMRFLLLYGIQGTDIKRLGSTIKEASFV